jgi:hypothetical protein
MTATFRNMTPAQRESRGCPAYSPGLPSSDALVRTRPLVRTEDEPKTGQMAVSEVLEVGYVLYRALL